MPNLVPVLPELILLTLACVVLVWDLFLDDRRRYLTYATTQLTLIAVAVAVWMVHDGEPTKILNGHFVLDDLAVLSKLFVLGLSFVVFIYSHDYLRQRGMLKGEYFVLGLTGVLGMMVMISSGSFLSLYLGLELLALSQYAMVAFDRDNGTASEAAMKYFVLGALASGMLLYGMSILYGTTGSLMYAGVSDQLGLTGPLQLPMLFGLVFIIIGIAFKFGAVPFHMWLPDVYTGAPTSVTLYLSTAPKIAALVMAMRLLVDGAQGLVHDWSQVLTLLAILSMAVGNLVAIAQTNIKRMLAYSAISHVGFLFLGLLAGTPEGYSAALFYTVSYAIMAAGALGMVLLLSRRGFEAENLSDFAGLNQRAPWYAFVMLLLMFSMAGVPPTLGFYAKLVVLQAVVQVDMVWLALVAVGLSVVGAYYYLRVLKIIYFDQPEDHAPLNAGTDMRLVLSLNGLAVLALGLLPHQLLSVCNAALAG